MRRIQLGLLVIPFIMNAALAQTPEIVKEVDDKLKALRTEDETLRQALANHPDVMVATAKLRVAEAELAQVRMVLTQKIAGLKAEIESRKAQVALHEKQLEAINKSGSRVSQQEILPFQSKVTELKTGLSRLVAEYEGLTKPAGLSIRYLPLNGPSADGSGYPPPNGQGFGSSDQGIGSFDARWMRTFSPAPGSPADRLKSVLDKPLKMEFKSVQAEDAFRELRMKAGNDVVFRVLQIKPNTLWKAEKTIVSGTGEMTFAGWVEYLLDELNSSLGPNDKENYEAYVREYGLLIAPRATTSKDALTLRQFAAQVRAEKAAMEPKQP